MSTGHRQRCTQLVRDRGEQLTPALLVVADPLEHPVELPCHGRDLVVGVRFGHPAIEVPEIGRPSGCREVVHRLQGASQGENQQHAADEQSRGARQRYPAERLRGLGLAWGQRADHDQCAEGEPSLSNEVVSMRNGPTEEPTVVSVPPTPAGSPFSRCSCSKSGGPSRVLKTFDPTWMTVR